MIRLAIRSPPDRLPAPCARTGLHAPRSEIYIFWTGLLGWSVTKVDPFPVGQVAQSLSVRKSIKMQRRVHICFALFIYSVANKVLRLIVHQQRRNNLSKLAWFKILINIEIWPLWDLTGFLIFCSYSWQYVIKTFRHAGIWYIGYKRFGDFFP